MEAARLRLAGDPRVTFARRAITRAAEAGGETHEALSEAAFARRAAAGEFLLNWSAHGVRYGVPAAIEAERAAGRMVVVNVSRAMIAQARLRLAPVRVLLITAPPAILRARLAARGRETPMQINARIARAGAYQIAGLDVSVITNDGDLEQGVAQFLAALIPETGSAPQP